MERVKEISRVRELVGAAREDGGRIGFVPTMGYLHEGHLSLVRILKERTDFVVMSIFVNKLQFNDLNDFDSYPKDIQRDMELAEKAGVDLLFLPDDSEMYSNNLTVVDVHEITENLCGAHRPGHFQGVFTVVSKLFNIVQPDVAVFGQKDIQQVSGIKKMVTDLNFPIEIKVAPIVREKDGLAMSSRNKHLSSEERNNALALNRSLHRAKKMLMSGERDSSIIIEAMKEEISSVTHGDMDYISVVSFPDLKDVDRIDGDSVIALAVYFGDTRLIDNMLIEFTGDSLNCII